MTSRRAAVTIVPTARVLTTPGEQRAAPCGHDQRSDDMAMVTVGLWVRLEAKPGKEGEVFELLREARAMVEDEPGTLVWFAVRFSESEFAIFDAFPDDDLRQDHLGGKVAAALVRSAPDLFAREPVIEHLDVLAEKIPGETLAEARAAAGA
jgi:quinol monooxygenase YgiN